MLVFVMFAYVRALFVSRHKLALEAVALRQQLAVFKRKQSRPKLRRLDGLFWIALRSLWPGWTEPLILVKPETVVSWHRAGFRLFRHPGRPKISGEIRQLIRRMKTDNPSWEHLAFMANYFSCGSQFPSRPCHDICDA